MSEKRAFHRDAEMSADSPEKIRRGRRTSITGSMQRRSTGGVTARSAPTRLPTSIMVTTAGSSRGIPRPRLRRGEMPRLPRPGHHVPGRDPGASSTKEDLRIRDHALLLFLYNTGARVGDALAVRAQDLQLERSRQVRLLGQGKKERLCPLWRESLRALRLLVRRTGTQL